MIGINGNNIASAWADNLFNKLDTNNQGYLDKQNLQTALSKISDSSSTTSSADDIFSQLDSNSDGKVTQEEMTAVVQNLFAQMNHRSQGVDMGEGGPEGPGGPPPMKGEDNGFTKEELSQQLEEIGSSESKRFDLISKIVNNFDQADSDGDGKVTFKEAMAWDKQSKTSGSSASTSADVDEISGTTTTQKSEYWVMSQIMKLMRAYDVFGSGSDPSTTKETQSVSNYM